MPLLRGIAFVTLLATLVSKTTSASVLLPGQVVRSAVQFLAQVRPIDGVPGVLLPFGFGHHDDEDPLDHDTRERLHDAIHASPGIHQSALADRSTDSLSTVRHHLDVLTSEGLVTTERLHGKRRYFPPDADATALTAAMEEPSTALVLRHLSRDGRSSVSDLARSLDLDPSTVSHHLSSLSEDGIVEREREGREVVARLAPAAHRALDADDGSREPVSGDD